MEDVLARPALSFGDDQHDVADLVLVALLTGTWGAFERSVAQGLELGVAHPDLPGRVELERALTQFRYEHRLIAAAELRAWLAERSLALADVEGVLRRRWLRAHFDHLVCPDGDVAAVALVLPAEVICSGALLEFARKLLAWHAGCVGLGEAVATADPAVVERLTAAALAATASHLPDLGAAELSRRAAKLAGLSAGYQHFCEVAVSEEAVEARLAERRVEWTVVSGEELSFALEGAARETRLRVVHDGDTLGEVAAALGVSTVRREFALGGAPDTLRVDLLAARVGDLVGPWREDERWRVLELCMRHEPEDALSRARARDELLSELVERASAGKVGIIGSL